MTITSVAVLTASAVGCNGKNNTATTHGKKGGSAALIDRKTSDRFDRTADTKRSIDEDVVLTIRGRRYDVAAFAAAHPGGPSILKNFHGRDATRAFDAVGHSESARAMLKDFAVGHPSIESVRNANFVSTSVSLPSGQLAQSKSCANAISRWRAKLFTNEDPRGLHKCMGVFSLLHFAYRYAQMILGDPSCSLGTRLGRGPTSQAILCLVPHAVLSMSSLLFHTVPRERVVGKPMIWQEFRAHNIIFGLRSVSTTLLAWMAIYQGNDPAWRRAAVVLSSLVVLAANAAADVATARLCQNDAESTTATMPYWDGCPVSTQRRFKHFYAYCQFLATLACLSVSNPGWPLAVLLPIQLASLLMTLVRKGLISTWIYHMAYTASLCMPFVVGTRHLFFMKSLDFVALLVVGWVMYQLRRRGISKYSLWLPVVAVRIALGDQFINWQIW